MLGSTCFPGVCVFALRIQDALVAARICNAALRPGTQDDEGTASSNRKVDGFVRQLGLALALSREHTHSLFQR
jgi:hypothetical protein